MSVPISTQDAIKQLDADATSPSESVEACNTSDSTVVQKDTTVEGEQALESHEVIELQTFSDRKVWIEEKIKFLVKMPPIDVFVGLDAIRTSSEEVPGVPSRAELQQWITEHDAIEKETEIFDKGELKKLRQLTKAATQRNLSPEDTDVIELTLTTILELDRLLHLLRDRSENLELLGIRLIWEENRIAAWVDRRKIIEDLQDFLDSRARWNRSIYDTISKAEESSTLTRRGSVTSFTSVASETSISSAAFSRSARFKLAELLSRDAAQFSGRISSLRHGKIAAAGKALDKLIDNSRKPVPEELLDEQDKLEEKGINDLEYIGKFISALVMQWRKADEIYVETKKDQSSAQNLLEEIETANMYHPTARQSASFISRTDTLLKRLALRGNPLVANSTFPRPEHPLFPDQKICNEILVQELSAEIAVATDMVRKSDAAAKEYRRKCEAVKRVEQLRQFAEELSETLRGIIQQLRVGVPSVDGDGSPPNLDLEQCLEPTRHSVFIALLPSILDNLATSSKKTDDVVKDFEPAIQDLNFSGLDETFKFDSIANIRRLYDLQRQAGELRISVSQRVTNLRDARKLWTSMEDVVEELSEIQELTIEAIERHKWRKESGSEGPLTPETPTSSVDPASDSSHAVLDIRVSVIRNKLSQDINPLVQAISSRVGEPLKGWLLRHVHDVAGFLEIAGHNLHILESVQRQATTMLSIREEFNALQIQTESIRLRFDSASTDILHHRPTEADMKQLLSEYQDEMDSIQASVISFTDDISNRVTFIAGLSRKPTNGIDFTRRRFSTSDPKFLVTSPLLQAELPIDMASIDAAVRADSNSYVIRLNGSLETLRRLLTQLYLTTMAVQLDHGVTSILEDISQCTRQTADHKKALVDLTESSRDREPPLRDMMKSIEKSFTSQRTRISRSFSPLRELLHRMERDGKMIDASIYDAICGTRRRALDATEAQLKSWEEEAIRFKDEIKQALETEMQRLQDIRAAEEKRIRDEEARIAAEEAEMLRREQLRLQEEELQRREEERLRAEAILEAERVRAAVDEAERIRLEREQMENEKIKALEEKIAAETRYQQSEQELLALQAVERAQLNRERDEIKKKLRQVEEELAAEKQARLLDGSRDNSLDLSADLPIIDEDSSNSTERTNNDIFGLRLASTNSQPSKSREILALQTDIMALRKRLRSLCINEAVRPKNPSTSILREERFKHIVEDFVTISADVDRLYSSAKDADVSAELRSLKTDVQESSELIQQLERLVDFSKAVGFCDAALSDLLEHIDSYPAAPLDSLVSSHQSNAKATPVQQMSSRLAFTRDAIQHMNTKFTFVANDPRASGEKSRIMQTWAELEEMSNDRLGGKKSRPPSVISSRNSSGRTSSASVVNTGSSKKSGFSTLNVSSTSRGKLLAPPKPGSRRASSGTNDIPSRSSSQLSVSSSTRSVSGPLNVSSSLYGSTFASRQRTTSLTASASTATINKRPSISPLRSRAQTGHSRRSVSPTMSESSTHSRRSFIAAPRASTSSLSNWARAPRNSLSSLVPRAMTPQKKSGAATRTKYVANPQSKLDVAVGDVVNKLPVGINVEGVSETWKDQSGKYWIGNQDPKLCFCRILRSQTVMVRVGGGWTELSKFIRDHFADSFRILPESPPRSGSRMEKWISSATLLEASEGDDPPVPPRTPEPTFPFVPTFALSTPSNNRSPHSIKSSPSIRGSPLTPLQFMRRAELDSSVLRPATPSKPSVRNKNAPVNSAIRNSVWRP